MPTSLTLEIDPTSPLHQRILDGVRDRIEASKRTYRNKHNAWIKAEDAAVAYMPETTVNALRRGQRENGKPQYTTIQIPYSYSMLMAAHTYWTTVFMSRTPVIQFTGRHGESSQNVQALEALMDYQVQVGEMLVPWYVWLYDVGKYGLGVTGIYWDRQFTYVSQIEQQEELFMGLIPTGKMKKVKTTRRLKGYEGNKVYNIRPFDFFPDPRVTLANFQKGEFCGVYCRLGWNAILKRASQGYYSNIDRIRPRKNPVDDQRIQGSPRVDLPNSDSMFYQTAYNNGGSLDSSIVPLYECCIELIPSEWRLGDNELPEKWMFTVDATFTTVIGAQPLGANHDRFPYAAIVMEPEGYGIVPRGMMEMLEPMQNTMDWLINSHFYNVRKILNGQFLVDPSRIMVSDLLDPSPGGIIRLKEAGYGSNPAEAVMQLQTADVTQTHLRDMQIVQNIGERAIGVNDQIMGAMNQGGRRTATEIRSANTFGVSRLKTNAELFSAMGWAPMSQMMLQNTQQFYDDQKKFKIAGDLMQQTSAQFMAVTPEDIYGFYDYVPVDGTLPVDRFAQANLWREMFMGLRQMPEIMAQYDMGKLFAWISQLAGLKNINQFKIQVVQDDMLARQAQAGNVIPMTPPATAMPQGGNPAAAPVPAAGPLPKQMTGTGPTG